MKSLDFLITNARLSKSLEKKNLGLFPCLFHRLLTYFCSVNVIYQESKEFTMFELSWPGRLVRFVFSGR